MGNDHASDGRRLRHLPESWPQQAVEGERIGKLTGVDAAWGQSAPAHVGKATLTGTLYRHAAHAGSVDHDDPHIGAALARAGSGAALPTEVRAPLEQQLGYSLDRVRIHTDDAAAAAARALGAEAFTVGEDIYFADGKFAPGSQAGKQLIAHEVTHVVQAWEGRTRRAGGLQVSDPGEALEREADAAAMQARTVHALAGSHTAAPRSAPASAGGSTLVLRKHTSHAKKAKKAKHAASHATSHEATADDSLITEVTQVLDRAAAQIKTAAATPAPAAPAAAVPAKVPTATVEIDFKNIVVKVKSSPAQAAQAPAPQAPIPAPAPAPTGPLATDSHGGTRTVDGGTLDVAMTRLAIPTTYRLGLAFPSAEETAVQAAIAKAVDELAATKELINETKAKIDPEFGKTYWKGRVAKATAATKVAEANAKKSKGKRKAAAEADAKEAAGAQAEVEAKAKKPVTAEDKAQAVKDLPVLEAKVAELEEYIKTTNNKLESDAATHTKKQLAAQVSGDKDANEFWCSGLSIWTLAASGYNINLPLRGTGDGKPFKVQPRGGGKAQVITLKQLIDGEAWAVEAVIQIQKNNLTMGDEVIELNEDAFLGGHRLGYDANGEATSGAVKGAAGAFAIFGLGTEIAVGAQKPGDFAQRREATEIKVGGEIATITNKLKDKKLAEDKKKELEARLALLQGENGRKVHQGKGHAWQVTEVRAKGQALFGAQGSPRLLAGKAPAAVAWLEGATFLIDRTTRPELVGAHVVDIERKIEANIASSTNTPNGTVRETAAIDAKTKAGKESTVFYGRLNESPWAAWKPATEASARAFAATQDAAPAAAPAADVAPANTTD